MSQEMPPPENNLAPQAMITISVAGLEHIIRRRGTFDTLIGEHSLNHILENCLDTGYLNQVLLTAPERQKEEQALAKLSDVLHGEYKLSICQEETEAAEAAPIPHPEAQKGLEVATRVELEDESPPCYLLHLHIDPAQAPQELTFEQRVLAVRLELQEKVAALDLRGLFRGNMQAKGEASQASDNIVLPSSE